jgi:hypothetical protein
MQLTIDERFMRTGRILSGLVVLFLMFDSLGKFLKPVQVVEAFARLGFPMNISLAIGTILLACTILYAIPRTSILGAVLLTGYLGGAVASQLRIGEPLFSHVLFPVYFGILLWIGLYLREDRLREFIGLRG